MKDWLVILLVILLVFLCLLCKDFQRDAAAAEARLVLFKNMAVANGSAEYQEEREFKWLRRKR